MTTFIFTTELIGSLLWGGGVARRPVGEGRGGAWGQGVGAGAGWGTAGARVGGGGHSSSQILLVSRN